MNRVRYKPAMWSFPETLVDQMLNPNLCSKQTEPPLVTKIGCSNVVLIKKQPGGSRLQAVKVRESARRHGETRGKELIGSRNGEFVALPPSPVEQFTKKLILKKCLLFCYYYLNHRGIFWSCLGGWGQCRCLWVSRHSRDSS